MIVSIILPDLRPGGAERLHVNLAEEWGRSGVSTEFVLRNAVGELLNHLPASAKVVDLKAARVRNVLGPLIQYLKESKPDAIIAAMWPLTVFAPLAARLAGYQGRVIISEHSPLSIAYRRHGRLHQLVMRASQRVCYPLADVRVAVSSGIADDLASLSGLSLKQFTVIHNPAALGKVNANAACPEQLSGRPGPIILTVGTLKPVKRHDLLIEAFARLPASLGATLCILGEGPMREELEQQIDRLGLQGRVLLPGFAVDPGPWYGHSDLFVLSSDYEGFGNVIVEAMEYGVPIVSTDCPVGPTEILAAGQYGALVPVGDAHALSQAILAALTEKGDQAALKLRAKDFAIEIIAQKYLELLAS
ncbi:glycosyltransferase [Marinobacter excellens]|jgi:glycosyltransferase involved in cell wall biosynthesis|uniref:Lipopolysaccharide core biosynthesis glycosyl transferase lpsD n=1 Tax=Marinobacter excellens LAMA 842 TaxID=1306954 RepID=A0A137SEP1_9GAMM|nr:glycosyltransferase [Marinobacter excellens]KXO10890.1 Lipopolysaccharide core biosynthesis glycosyl transferase lpsD [Marinobacter excellens LAMA 842]